MSEVEQIAAWLDGLEVALEDVIRTNRDPDEVETMRRRRGIYAGIASEVRGGNWRPRSASTKSAVAEVECTGRLVHDEFTPCPKHDERRRT